MHFSWLTDAPPTLDGRPSHHGEIACAGDVTDASPTTDAPVMADKRLRSAVQVGLPPYKATCRGLTDASLTPMTRAHGCVDGARSSSSTIRTEEDVVLIRSLHGAVIASCALSACSAGEIGEAAASYRRHVADAAVRGGKSVAV